jgi:hypothetical protein
MRPALFSLVLLAACDSSDDRRSDAGSLPPDAGSRPDAGPPDGGAADAQSPVDAGTMSIAEYLATIDGLVATRVETPKGYDGYTKYQLELEQPRDHEDAADGVFTQHAYLLVLNDTPTTAPFVLETHGYSLYDIGRPHELSTLLGANELGVEYRYNGASVAADPEFEDLTPRQGAADAHRWFELLSPFFRGPWISTGASRGAEVAMHHRFLFPSDVAGTVAYALPDIDGPNDGRYGEHLRAIAPASCHAALERVQRAMLSERRAEMIDAVAAYSEGYTRVGGAERALEASVVELAMSFWQAYGYYEEITCERIPAPDASAEELANLLIYSGALDLAEDATIGYLEPYYVLARRYEGYPALPSDYLADRLSFPAVNLEEGFIPEGVTATYDPSFDEMFDAFMEADATRVLETYGGYDCWARARFEPNEAREYHAFGVEASGHYVAQSISSLTAADRERFTTLLRAWTVAPERAIP